MTTSSRLLSSIFLCLIALPAAAQVGAIQGTVRSAEFDLPLESMTVTAYTTAGFLAGSTVTDSQGRYAIPLVAGSYRILAYDNAGAYAVNFYREASSFETSDVVVLSPGQGVVVDFRLARGVQFSGVVRDAATAQPLETAVVAAYNVDGTRRTFSTTNSNGAFTIVVPAGAYKLVAYHDSLPYIPQFYPADRLFDTAATVTPPSSSIAFSLSRGAKVRGVVTDNVTGARVGDLKAIAYDLNGTVRYRTDVSPTGEFSFVLPDGSYKFAVEDPSGKYAPSFHRAATSFAAAASISINQSSAPPTVEIVARRGGDPLPKTIQWVLAAANQGGGSGQLQTDLWLFNPSGEEPATITLTFLRANQENASATGVPITVLPRQQVTLVNVLQSVFGTNGGGALRLESESPFRVTSRTFNTPPGGGGAFGLALAGQSIGASLSRGTIAGLSQSSGGRTNLALLNPQPQPITVKVEVFSGAGALLGTAEVPLGPSEWKQPNIFGLTGVGGSIDGAYAIVSSTQGSFFSYAAVVDGPSGDATVILPEPE